MDAGKVDQILQYALLCAGGEDDVPSRQLGPIHLLKYVYLADLAFAQNHGGKTCTGAPWQFYKFGPWSCDVLKRIEPALNAVHAVKKSFASQYREDGEWERWNLRDEGLKIRLEETLPWEVCNAVKRAVHQFGTSTPDLLAFVYNTPPMRHAAPMEMLDFSVAVAPVPAPETAAEPFLTARQKKKLREGMATLKARAAARMAGRLRHPGPRPRYDEVYFDGLAWLDSLAGEPLPEGPQDAVFANALWKSPARKDADFPA